MQKNLYLNTHQAFGMIGLLITVAVIGILAVFVFPNLFEDSAEKVTNQQNSNVQMINSLENSIQLNAERNKLP